MVFNQCETEGKGSLFKRNISELKIDVQINAVSIKAMG